MRISLAGAPVLIGARELSVCLAQHEPIALLDVRWALGDPNGREHFLEGHIPSAVFVDLDRELAAPPSSPAGRHPLPTVAELERAARSWGVRQGARVIVYDDSGALAAARAWWLLRSAGVADVRILDGGLGAWEAAGGALETGETRPHHGDVRLQPYAAALLDATATAELARSGVLLDARAGERYRGEQERVDPRAGHIPGALSAPTSKNLAADGRFLDTAQLRERFEQLGADGSAPIGVYCGSGVTAAHELAALAIVGIDGALYPGSWSQWSSDPQRPAARGSQPG